MTTDKAIDAATKERPRPGQQIAYRPAQACQQLGIGMTKLYAQIKAGRIKTRKDGNTVLITHEELESWVKSLPEK